MPAQETTLSEEIEIMIQNLANNNPAPQRCTIIKNYTDTTEFVDIKTDNGDTLKTVKVMGNNRVGDTGILIFLDGNNTKPFVITSDNSIFSKFGLNQSNSNQFNYAAISKTEDNIEYSEFWILSNAYYDYNTERFVKINPDSNSFGIQIQSEGSYPGESELGYADNTSIGIWRNPQHNYVAKDTTNYDYSDWENKNYIGAKRKSDNKWIAFGISAGWSNSFMMDSFGGMTIGGAGFEIDGNGIFPYTRLTSSRYSDGTDNYYLLGLLDNAYHPTISGWGCDSNSTWSWFIGLKIPEASNLVKDNENASFVVMYNDTPYNSDNIHELNVDNWNIVFEVNKNGFIP